MHNPKISIITVCYNSEKTLQDTIDSVTDQSYENIEYIVIDGNSTDNTKQILEKNKNQIDIIVSEPDNGIYDAMNKGIKKATGGIVGFLHADDIFTAENTIQKIAEKFDTTNADMIYGDLLYVQKNNINKTIRYWKSNTFSIKKLKFGWMPPHPTVYCRKHVYDECGNFNTKYRISADYDFMMRLLKSDKFKIVYLPKVIVNMRIGGESNKNIKNLIQKTMEDWDIIKKNKIGGFYTLMLKNLRKIIQWV